MSFSVFAFYDKATDRHLLLLYGQKDRITAEASGHEREGIGNLERHFVF